MTKMFTEAHLDGTIKYVIVAWPEGYTFGDSFQHAQGKFAAAKLLGVSTNSKRLSVSAAVVTVNRVTQTVWMLRP